MFQSLPLKKIATAGLAFLAISSQAEARQSGISIKHVTSEVSAGDCVSTTFELHSLEVAKNVKISLSFFSDKGVKIASGSLDVKKIGAADGWYRSPDATKTVNLKEEYVMPDQQYCLPPSTVKVTAATALIDGKTVDLVAQKLITEDTYRFVPMKIKIGK